MNLISGGIPVDKSENSVLTRVLSGQKGGPRGRAFGRHGRFEGIKSPLPDQPFEVGEKPFRDKLLE